MKYAELPDGTLLEFPDEIRADVMDAAVRKHLTTGDNTTRDDVLKTLPYIIPKAAAGLAGLPGTINELTGLARNKMASTLPPEPDNLRAINNVLSNSSLTNLLGRLAPSANTIRGAGEKITGPWYDPQTRTGKVVDTAGQTALMMGKNWLTVPYKAAALTTGITAGTEGAGALTNDNPWMRLIGGLLGGVVPAASNALKTRSGAVVREAIGQPTKAEIADAIAMQRRGELAGIPLMGTESLDRGHQLASAVYAHPSGNQTLDAFLRGRADKVKSSVDANLLAATGPRDTAAANAARAQQAATDVISAAERARTKATSPFYQAAQNESIPANAMRPVSDAIQTQIYQNPIGASADRALGNWYNQAFPNTVESVAQPAGAVKATPRARAPFVNPEQDDIITAIRKLGGVSPADEAVGSLAKANPFPASPDGPVWRQRGGGSMSKSGHSLDTMSQFLEQRGYPVRGPDDVMEAIANASMGKPTYANAYDVGGALRGGDPMVELTDTLRDLTSQFRAKNNPAAVAPALGQGAALPETNVGRLNKLYKNLGIEGELPAIGATSDQVMASYPARQVQSALGDVLKQNNPNIAKGMQLHADITQSVIDPLKAGPVGRLATRTGFEAGDQASVAKVSSAIGDANSVRPADIKTLYTKLNGQDPQAFPGMVQTHLENQLNTALGDLRSGSNPTAGSKFRQAIAGTPQERANFDEMMRGVALAQGKNPQAVVQGANKLLEVLERTGRTPGIGSQTQGRGEIAREMGRSVIGDTMSMISLTPTRPLARRWVDRLIRVRYADVAKALTAPDSVEQLVKMAKLNPNGLTASYYAAAILGLDNATAGP